MNARMEERYDPKRIEPEWQRRWEEENAHAAVLDREKEKYYLLEMFPYPSGRIHVGHVRNYTIGDVIARFKRMRGFNVIHPMGWDAFGMPAENAAIAGGIHPAKWTYENIDAMRAQLKRMGFSYDWSREIATCRPEYYKWEQWLFLKMYEKGMAYRKESFVNWCETCATVLANEQVEQGGCWRCGKPVRQKQLEQWFFKISDYAEDLLAYCDKLPGWPEKVLTMQKNWIGKSEGAYIEFPVEGTDASIRVFTTRHDTVFGATFMVLAPEHPLVARLSEGTPEAAATAAFTDRMAMIDRSDRAQETFEKEGVFIGAWCKNPMSGARMPIFTANFALMEYGTGAVMAVPAHDQRDFEFARKYGLPVIVVVRPPGTPLESDAMTEAYDGPGEMVNSGDFTGMDNEKAKESVAEALQQRGLGEKTVNYRLRDWGISRQRYWGAPIPMIHCAACGIMPVPEADLPVILPEDTEMLPGGRSPLPEHPDFAKVTCPKCGDENARRDTDTMDTFVESSWYYERYCSPRYDAGMFDVSEVGYWMPVDQYVGGVEHAILHLLYSRYYTRVLHDMGLTAFKEPFTRLLTQGMVCKETHRCPNHGFRYPEEVNGEGEALFCTECEAPIEIGRIEKMSKSKKNVIDPNELLARYGADTTRLFNLFAAPPERDLEWNEQGVEGCARFLQRVWRLVYHRVDEIAGATPYAGDPAALSPRWREVYRKIHETIRRVTNDIEDRYHFNTAIAAVMELVNELYAFEGEPLEDDDGRAVMRAAVETAVVLLSPMVPHIAEDLWRALGHAESMMKTPWPAVDEAALEKAEKLIVLQVDGKLRSRFTVPADAEESVIKEIALADERARKFIGDKPIRNVVVVKDKLVNIVL